MISILIVNFNCLYHTKNLIDDIKKQTYKEFDLTVVDQNSSEEYTDIFLSECAEYGYTVIRNASNVPLNHIWNNFANSANGDVLCFLNNDIRITSNFLKDVKYIFDKEMTVGMVIHATNNKSYNKQLPITSYKILNEKIRQGWDFSIKKSIWNDIPEQLLFYCGDDFIFENTYKKKYNVAISLSSPVIHFLSQTKKSKYNTEIPERNPEEDIFNYINLGFEHYLQIPTEYSNLTPTFLEFKI